MMFSKLLHRHSILSILSSLLWSGLLSSLPSSLSIAATTTPDSPQHTPLSLPPSLPPSPPPLLPPSLLSQSSSLDFSDTGRPRRRQGGGSRGSCLIADRPPLTALVPESSTGYTIAPSPSFWFYLPYSLTADHAMEFVLKDSQENTVYRSRKTGEGMTPGLINLRLPTQVVLTPNQSYEWYLLVHCDAQNQERFVFVNGAVQRLERPDLEPQLASASADRTRLYQTAGLWYDALDQAATQLRTDPQDPQHRRGWAELLESVGLTHLSAEPIAACCSLDP